MSQLAVQKRARLQTIVAERAAWTSQLLQVKRMHGWVLEVEHLLDGGWAQPGEVVSNATVGSRLDAWREQMAKLLTDGTLSELERECRSRVLAGALQPAPVPGAVLRPKGLSPHEQRDGAQHSETEAHSIAAAVVAKTGTRICCATGATLRMRPGGSKIAPIESFWSCVLPGSTALGGASCDRRQPPPTVSN